MIATAESFGNHAEAGHFVDELDNLLQVGTQDALRKLVGDGRLSRHKLAGQFLYSAADRTHQTHQLRARRLLMATPGLVHPLPDADRSASMCRIFSGARLSLRHRANALTKPYTRSAALSRTAPPSELACSWLNWANSGLSNRSGNRTVCGVRQAAHWSGGLKSLRPPDEGGRIQRRG